jgi:phage FluMu gp28-like protein
MCHGNLNTADRVKRFGKDILQKAFANAFFEDFQQEYECNFIDSAESYISLDLIHANTPGAREEDWQKMGMASDGEVVHRPVRNGRDGSFGIAKRVRQFPD